MSKMPYTLRPLDKSDLKQASHIYGLAFDEVWSEAALLDLMRMKGTYGFCVINSQNSQIVAFVLARHLFEEGEILTIAVDPKLQGKGLATSLMQTAENYATAQKAEKMFLEVAADNKSAQALYNKLGYQELSRRKGYYRRAGGVRVDAYNLYKEL